MKRWTLLLVVLAVGLFGMMTDRAALQAQDVSGEITVWSWDIAAESLAALVPAFNEQFPNVTVTVEDVGNQATFDRGLAGCAAGGVDLPDVYSVENNEAEVFWNRFPDCFTDLNTLGAQGFLDQFPEFKLTELQLDEATFAVPWDSGPVVIFYRRDLYDAAGIDPASIETWDDFRAAGEQVLEATGTEVGTLNKGGDDEWFRMIANQNGCFYFNNAGTEVTVNQPGCVRAYEIIAELTDAGVLAFGGWAEQIQFFQASDVSSAMFGGWYEGTIRTNAPDQAGQWGVFPMPASEPGGVRAANIGGSALALPASSDNKEAAFEFIRFALATTEGQVTMLEEFGLIPSYLPALDDPFVSEGQDFWGDQPVFEVMLETLGEIPPARGTQFFQEARDIMTANLSEFIDGEFDSAQAALDAAAQQISAATGLSIAN